MSGIIGKNASRSSGVIGTSDAGIASLAADSSPQLGGFLDAAGNYIQMEKGGDIASASPTVIDTDGDFFAVTGTTNFSAFTVAADRHFFLEFGGALTMTHGAGTLDLPGAANITTAASDVGEFVSTAANVVTCVNYTKRDGTAVVAAGGGKIAQVVSTQVSAVATTTTVLPRDDTIPQNTEGGEFMTLAVTPTNSSNKLLIYTVANLAHSVANAEVTVALFQDSDAATIAAVTRRQSSRTNAMHPTTFTHTMTAGGTSEITFKIRAGGTTGSTCTFNGAGGVRAHGGFCASTMIIMEITV